MTHQLLYLIGEPGVGKTTAMSTFTARWSRAGTLDQPIPRTVFTATSGAVAAIELGRRRPGGFSGTDALSMSAVVPAEAYLRSGKARAETSLLLGEGARLANRRFLGAAVIAGFDVTVVHLVGADAAAERRAARGSAQAPSWVRGAATRAANLAAAPPPGVRIMEVEATASPTDLAAYLDGLLRKKGWSGCPQ